MNNTIQSQGLLRPQELRTAHHGHYDVAREQVSIRMSDEIQLRVRGEQHEKEEVMEHLGIMLSVHMVPEHNAVHILMQKPLPGYSIRSSC